MKFKDFLNESNSSDEDEVYAGAIHTAIFNAEIYDDEVDLEIQCQYYEDSLEGNPANSPAAWSDAIKTIGFGDIAKHKIEVNKSEETFTINIKTTKDEYKKLYKSVSTHIDTEKNES